MIEESVEILRPGIESLITSTNRVVACIAVIISTEHNDQGVICVPFWEGIIGEPDPTKWPREYNRFALKKAGLTHRTKLPSHLVIRNAPHLLQKGDFKFGGSDYHEGISVGTSGLDWYNDYLVSSAFIAILRAKTIEAMEKELTSSSLFMA